MDGRDDRRASGMSRRHLLAGAAGLAAAGAGAGGTLTLASAPAAAAEGDAAATPPRWHRFKLGDFTVTAYLDGLRPGEGPHPTFGANQPAEAVEALAAANFLPPKQMVNMFTPVLVDTGRERVLFDTGLGAGARPAMGNLALLMADSGVTAEDVDVVVITHMHGDHVGGLMTDGAPTFPKARYVTGSREFDFWTKEAPAENAKPVQANVVPLADRFTFVEDGGAVVSGITGMNAFGHSPGHMIYHLESAGRRLVITADTANHYVVSLQKPDWEVRFDMDKAMAAAARRTVFGMLAADKVPFIGYHMPFPAVGYVEPLGDGFRYVPASYQFLI